jgi:hypothetical protein
MDATTGYDRAKKRVEEVEGFYIHLSIYVMAMVGLAVIDFTAGDGWWLIWPATLWGIAVAIHALAVFVIEGGIVRRWEDRKLRQYMGQDHTAGQA